jgi:trimeric autotransporter adhesin
MPILGSSAGATKGAPGVPTSVSATSPTSTTASVSFTAPGFSKLPITSYTVTSSPGGLTGTGASSPITVSGLTAGTAYTFTVTATNANGTSTASSASNSATPTYSVSAWTLGTAYPVARNQMSAGTRGTADPYVFHGATSSAWGNSQIYTYNGSTWTSRSGANGSATGTAATTTTRIQIGGGFNGASGLSATYYSDGADFTAATSLPSAKVFPAGAAIGGSDGYMNIDQSGNVLYRTGTGSFSTGTSVPYMYGSAMATRNHDWSKAYSMGNGFIYSATSLSGAWSSAGNMASNEGMWFNVHNNVLTYYIGYTGSGAVNIYLYDGSTSTSIGTTVSGLSYSAYASRGSTIYKVGGTAASTSYTDNYYATIS